MAQVPYSPVPTTTPATVALPGMHVDAPVAAFGGAVAQGLTHLGTAVEGAGNELFARALALKQLDNESEARDADADYMIKVGKLHADYSALEGKDRAAAYDGYAKSVQDLRVQIRSGLSNPMAQKMYDASSLSTMSRTIFNGAGQAASAQVQYNKGTLAGQVNIDAKTLEDDPNDATLAEEKFQRIRESTAKLAAMEGFDESNPHTVDMQAKAVSAAAVQRINGMAKNQPYKAGQLVDDYISKGILYGDDINKARNTVETFANTTGVAAISDSVLARHRQTDGSFDKSVGDMQAEAKEEALKAYPTYTGIDIRAAAALDRQYSQVKYAEAQDTLARKQEISSWIVKGVTDLSMLPPATLNKMTDSEKRLFPAQANAYQHSQNVQTNQKAYDQLLGMYNNDNAGFMNQDVYKVPGLSKSNIDFFLGLQRKAQAGGDPRVSRAMGWLKGAVPQALDDLGVTGPRLDRDTHNQFVGALHSAIQGWQEEYGKPPSEKDIVGTIYPSIMRQVAEPGWLWGSNNVPAFKSQLPAPVLEQATKSLGRDPTVGELEQIRNEYLRMQFNQLYKTQKAKVSDRFPQ